MKSCHRDFIAESIARYERCASKEDPSFDWLSTWAPAHAEIANRAREIAMEAGDAHGAAVAESVRSIALGAEKRGQWPRFSAKQGFVVGRVLAERYGTARALVADMFGITDRDIENAWVR